MSDEPKYRDEEWLREQYVTEERSSTDLAEECGCVPSTVRDWLKRHGIKTRSRSEIGRLDTDQRLRDGEWLREQYVTEERSSTDLAEECGCTPTTLRKWLKRHGINTRSRSRAQRLNSASCLRDGEWLREQYVEKKRSTPEIAEECGCNDTTVWDWLKRHGIKARSRSEALAGELNPAYTPGADGNYGSGWNEAKRRRVRERDGHTCQDPTCSVTQVEHKAEYGQKLHVHHLIKARDIDDPEERNAPENLITLCRDCHRRWERLSEAGIRPQIDGVTAD